MLIELNDVRKAFNQGKPNEFWAIHGISLKIEPNKVTCLKGASGSGKTTLLSMIGCLSRPTSGRITLAAPLHLTPTDGGNAEGLQEQSLPATAAFEHPCSAGEQILSGLPERFLTDIRRHTFGFIFQKFNLIQGMTVLENIMLPAYPLGPNHTTLMESAHRLLDHFNLSSKADNPVEWLSGGEAQRVAICRALINDPDILIADEPTANLDTKLSQEFMGLIDELYQSGKTILISSHDPVIFESPVVDRVVEMRDGRVVER